MSFGTKLMSAVHRNDSLVCVGLDPELRKLPQHLRGMPDPIASFCRQIIDRTKDLVCAYKPNLAFYESLGPAGITSLERILADIPSHIPVILDAKRGDIGNTAAQYARFLFEILNGDAVTVNPYMGSDSLEPFLQFQDRGVFVVALTSNSGAKDLQMLTSGGKPLYMHVVNLVNRLNTHGNAGLVVGATQASELTAIRRIIPAEMPLLIPGIGAQGGDLRMAIECGCNSLGEGAVVNSSRGILYASAGEDFAEKAAQATLELRDAINNIRRKE